MRLLVAALLASVAAVSLTAPSARADGARNPFAADVPAAGRTADGAQSSSAYLKGMHAIRARDFAAAYTLLAPLAAQGVPEAQYHVGLMLFAGSGTPKDEAAARAMLLEAAAAGVREARLAAAEMLDAGLGGPPDRAAATELLREAVDAGDNKAAVTLGLRLLSGRGTAVDTTRGLAYLRLAADAGVAEALKTLGDLYQEGGFGLEKDLKAAEEWYRKAAQRGSAGAANNLAFMLAEAGRDLEEALALSRAAVRAEPAPANIDTLAWVLFKLDRSHDALEVVDEAIAVARDGMGKKGFPGLWEMYEHRGQIQGKLGAKAEGKESLRTALDLIAVEEANARHALKRIESDAKTADGQGSGTAEPGTATGGVDAETARKQAADILGKLGEARNRVQGELAVLDGALEI